MYFVVYISTAARLYEDEDLDRILQQSRSWNTQMGITGLLLYKEGHFMQFLEGSKAAVLELLGMIKRDPRHQSMIILFKEEHGIREFASWAMAFHRLHLGQPAPPGFTADWELPFSSEEFLTNPTRALQFLLSFKTTVTGGEMRNGQAAA